jgi:hypothetical protein
MGCSPTSNYSFLPLESRTLSPKFLVVKVEKSFHPLTTGPLSELHGKMLSSHFRRIFAGVSNGRFERRGVFGRIILPAARRRRE